MSELRAGNLKKRYKSRTVVQDVSLSVNSGEVVGLLGPNGAGKTTCFYMMVGLVPLDGGSIYLDERDLTQLPIPKHWPLDGGRYAGTADAVITRDPDSGYLNVGTYRMMLQGKKEAGQRFVLSKEQQEELEKFKQKRAEANKKLKRVRRELAQDIESLELRTKVVNIGGIPLLVAAIGIALAIVRVQKTKAK